MRVRQGICLQKARSDPRRSLRWDRPQTWRPWIAACSGKGLVPNAQNLRASFSTLRSYHASRPSRVEPYYREGIVPFDEARFAGLVDECFTSITSDPTVAVAIERFRDVQFGFVRGGRVHFAVDEVALTERDGYQLIYGSLSLLSIAIQIDKSFRTDFKRTLRERGAPAIFVCEVPLELIEDEVLERLAAMFVSEQIQIEPGKTRSSVLSFHYSIPAALPPNAIAGHYRPSRVVDSAYGHHIGV